MKTPEEIKKGLEACGLDECHGHHTDCPYDGDLFCIMHISGEARVYIQQLENQIGELTEKVAQLETRGWELFDLLSSAWYGKGCYFKQDDGTVYSRASCQYLSIDQAIDEFATALTNAHEVE